MDDNKKIFAGIGAFFVLVLVLYFFFGSGGDDASSNNSKARKSYHSSKSVKSSKKDLTTQDTFSRGSFSAPAHSVVSANVCPFTDEELERRKENRKKMKERLVQNSQKWLEEKANDESLDAKTREKYRLKLNKNFIAGKIARRNKDYKSALKSFYQALKDPSATITSKYYIYMNIKAIARLMGDIDLFIIASKEEGKMLAENDIPAIDLKKSSDALEWITEFETYVKARKNSVIFNKLVDDEIARTNGAVSRAKAQEKINGKIKEFEDIFKGRKA